LGGPRSVLVVFVATFALATVFSLLSDSVLRSATLVPGGLVLVGIIAVGIVFDIIGLATAAASHSPLHAMAAKKIPGARQALRLVRNAPRVATICNDLIGDICGTVSGAAGAAIVLHVLAGRVSPGPPAPGGPAVIDGGLWTVLAVALVAAVTVGGKAVGKSVAIGRANRIVFGVGRFLWWVEQRLGLVLLKDRPTLRRVYRRRATQTDE
jgi:CBS domain containing-hemolysin-like protein